MRNTLFRCIHLLVTRHAWLVVLASFLSASLAGFYGVATMEMITDQDRLLSEDLPYHARYMEFLRTFGDLEFLYVVVEGPSKPEMTAFADALAERLHRSPDIKNVIYSFDTRWIRDYALLYAPVEDLQTLHQELQTYKNDIQDLFATPSMDTILDRITDSLADPQRLATQPSAALSGELQILLDALQGRPNTELSQFSQWEDELHELEDTKYLWSDRGNFLLMLIMPNKDYSTLSVIERPLQRVREDIWLTQMDFPSVKAGLTGRPALQADEMSTTNQDMMESSLIALVGVAVLFVVFFRELVRPLLAIIALLIAMGWTYGFVALTLGHLNLLSLVFALVLIGLGIDFGIHFLHRYQEELDRAGNPAVAIGHALQHIGSGIITGALTSCIAFMLAMLTDFKGLAELGYVAGMGIVFCLLAMLVTLPSLLMVYDSHVRKSVTVSAPFHLIGLQHVSRHPLFMVLAIVAATLLLSEQFFRVHFNDNLLELQAEGLESVEYEIKLLNESEHSTWYCAFTEPTLREMKETDAILRQCETVATTESLDDVFPLITPQKQEVLMALRTFFSTLDKKELYAYQPNPTKAHQLASQIQNLLFSLSQQNSRSSSASSAGMEDYEALFRQLQELAGLLSGAPSEVTRKLDEANRLLLETPRAQLEAVEKQVFQSEPTLEDLPSIFHTLYVGKDNSLLIMAYPKENIWESGPMKKFVDEMRQVDPHVTGTPIQVYESSLLMRQSFIKIGIFSYIAVLLLVFLDFLSFRALFYIIVPLSLGIIWLIELMGLAGINLNLANFFAIPILIGIGVDDAVHFFHRYQEDHDVERAIYTTGTTLTLTTLTTFIGFGSLVFASHKGLRSLGMLMAIGTVTYWFACVVFLPALIKVLHKTPMDLTPKADIG
ncbi:MAG: MMPL family transporter [bacterium]|jgi:hopanoid biosynthesis associated RND transporter like protein HpnN|nr:MMPL family transporter [bacterium]